MPKWRYSNSRRFDSLPPPLATLFPSFFLAVTSLRRGPSRWLRSLSAAGADPAQAVTLASLTYPVAVKAQVAGGGRGKAGGVKLVSSPQEAADFARSLLGTRLVTFQSGAAGQPVNAVLVEGMSAFGLYLAGIHQRASPDDDAAPVVLAEEVQGARSVVTRVDSDAEASKPVLVEQASQPALPAPELPTMSAARWAVERLDFVAGGSVRLADAIADYRACAAAAGVAPLTDREFRHALIGAVLDLELEIHGQELRDVALPPERVE